MEGLLLSKIVKVCCSTPAADSMKIQGFVFKARENSKLGHGATFKELNLHFPEPHIQVVPEAYQIPLIP